MDIDRQATLDGLTRALTDSGLSQSEFAYALGTSGSRFSTYRTGRTMPTAAFYLRAQRIGASLRLVRSRGWMTPPLAADAIAAGLTDNDEMWAYKMALQARDHLRELLVADAARFSAAWEAIPRSSGDQRWDVLLAGLTAHEFESAGMTAPPWAQHARMDDDWLLASPLLDDDEVRRATPGWLSERNVYIAARDLVTA